MVRLLFFKYLFTLLFDQSAEVTSLHYQWYQWNYWQRLTHYCVWFNEVTCVLHLTEGGNVFGSVSPPPVLACNYTICQVITLLLWNLTSESCCCCNLVMWELLDKWMSSTGHVTAVGETEKWLHWCRWTLSEAKLGTWGFMV